MPHRPLEPLGHAQSIVTFRHRGRDGATWIPRQSTACYVWRLMRREGVAQDQGGCLDASSSRLGAHRTHRRARAAGSRVVSRRDRDGRRRSTSRGSGGRSPRTGPGRSRSRGSSGREATTAERARGSTTGSARDGRWAARADRRGAGLRRRAGPGGRVARRSDRRPGRDLPPRGRERPHGLLRPRGRRARSAEAPREPRRRRCRAAPTRSIRRSSTTPTGSTSSSRSSRRRRPSRSSRSSSIPEGSEDTTNDWCVLHMSGDQVGNNGKQFADYPMVGFTEDRVTLTTNQFDFSHAPAIGGSTTCRSSRSARRRSTTAPCRSFRSRCSAGAQTEDPDGSQAFTIVPTVSFGGSPTVQFMASLDFNGSTGKLILWRLKVVDGVAAGSRGRRSPAGRWTSRASDGSVPGTRPASTTTGTPETSGSPRPSGTATSDGSTRRRRAPATSAVGRPSP